MSRSNDPKNFFQTSAALSEEQRREAKAKNNAGNPIRLQSKILAVIADPDDDAAIFLAESAGTARRIALNVDKKQKNIYTGPAAPLTSLALSTDGMTLFAGCWDKSVWSWNVMKRTQGQRFAGHSDFVKCVAYTRVTGTAGDRPTELLVSGGQDAVIIVWNVSTGEKMHILRGHTRGVLDLTFPPIPDDERFDEQAVPESVMLWSAGSDQSILRWQISQSSPQAIPFTVSMVPEQEHSEDSATAIEQSSAEAVREPSLIIHETSINRLRFGCVRVDNSDDEDETTERTYVNTVLLTASSDNSAKISRCDAFFPESSSEDGWVPVKTFLHPDFVRDIVMMMDVDSEDRECLIATACRDEEVRIWDPDDLEAVEPIHIFSGHFEEVTGLVVRIVNDESVLVSISIDATVRVWPATRSGITKLQREEAKRAQRISDSLEDESLMPVEAKTIPLASMMTAEEEQELADLMEDD